MSMLTTLLRRATGWVSAVRAPLNIFRHEASNTLIADAEETRRIDAGIFSKRLEDEALKLSLS
jgi:hypothetical protein